jgi:hypothetical protein
MHGIGTRRSTKGQNASTTLFLFFCDCCDEAWGMHGLEHMCAICLPMWLSSCSGWQGDKKYRATRYLPWSLLATDVLLLAGRRLWKDVSRPKGFCGFGFAKVESLARPSEGFS